MEDTDLLEQTEVEYDLEQETLSFKFNIDGIKLQVILMEGEEEDIFVEKGEISIEAKENVCTNIYLNIFVDEIAFEDIIIKTPQYINFDKKIDPIVLEEAMGNEIFSIEYVLYPDLLKDISLQIGDSKWVDFSELGIDESINLMDISNYYIKNINLQRQKDEEENL